MLFFVFFMLFMSVFWDENMILGKIWVQIINIINITKVLTKFRLIKSGNPHKY